MDSVAGEARNYVGGRWVPAASGATLTSLNPADHDDVLGPPRRAYHARLGDALNRVLQRQDGNGSAAGLGSFQSALKELCRSEGPRGVVNRQPAGIRGGQAGGDRVAPSGTADDHARSRG